MNYIPRFCKICRLIINYPEYNAEKETYRGIGLCPAGIYTSSESHYKIMIAIDNSMDFRCDVILEKLFYDDVGITLAHNENLTYIYKEGRDVIILPGILEGNFKDKNYMINKIDTLINFS